MTRLLAFLAESYSAARIEITHGYELVRTQGSDRGVIHWQADEVPFRIITRAEQLRGLELLDYVELPHFGAGIGDNTARERHEMRELAKSRIR